MGMVALTAPAVSLGRPWDLHQVPLGLVDPCLGNFPSEASELPLVPGNGLNPYLVQAASREPGLRTWA